MMVYIIAFVIAIAAAGGAGFVGGKKWVQADWDADKAARLEAEAKVQALTDKAVADAENKIQDMMTVRQVTEEELKKKAAPVAGRVTSERAQFAAFSNPACNLPGQSFGLLVAALKGTRTGVVVPAVDETAAPTLPPPAVAPATPATPTADGRPPKPVPRPRATP